MKSDMSSEAKNLQNVQSSLLTSEENQKIFSSLGKQCQTLCTTVVQLFLTEEPYHSSWIKKYCGVVCFVKDCDRRSYFIKVYDMDKSVWVWEQELYSPFMYKPACSFFHTFEADNCMAGLNFADNDEALSFKAAVQKRLDMRDERKRQKRRIPNNLQPTNAGIVAARAKSQSSQSLANGRDEKREKKKKKLRKEDIGAPSNFTHLQHVGWHPEKGFNVEGIEQDQELVDFFKLAGVSDKDLKDNETRTFIYDFIENHGGVERAKKEIEGKSAPPPVPARDIPQTPRQTPRGTVRSAAPPPPPPPPPALPPVFQPSSVETKMNSAPPPPPPPPMPSMISSAVPPPPPPPPPPGMPAAPSGGGRPNNSLPPPPVDNRSALLDQIRRGKELHHVEVNGNNNDEPAQGGGGGGGDPRNALLNQIRQGIVLKSVADDSRHALPHAPIQDGLAAALQRALQERSKAIQQTDESGSSSEEDDGDDWD